MPVTLQRSSRSSTLATENSQPLSQLTRSVTPQQHSADAFQSAAPVMAQSAATAAATPVLAVGQSGPEVKAWQDLLVRLGYLTPAEVATGPGIFGPKTEQATRVFQKEHGLEA